MSGEVIRRASPELIRAAAQRRGWKSVMTQLGLAPTDENIVAFRARAIELAIDVRHLRRHGGLETLSPQVLRDVAHGAASQAQVLTRLGLRPGGATYAALERAALANCVTLPPRGSYGAAPRRPTPRCTDEQVRAAFEDARSIAEVLRRLGLVPRGGNYEIIKSRLHELGLDVTRLRGQSWARGGKLSRTPLEELLVRGRTCSGPSLAKRLIEAGVVPRACSCCSLEEWRGQPIPLELDHINGEHDDNRLENLRLLCPNCHALTDTYRGRNIRRRRNLTVRPE